MKKRAIDGERRESAGVAQRGEEESRFFDSPLRRYGAGHVSELLLARGKKLDDEQVGRGLNEVCAGCTGRWGWMNETAGARSTKQVD